VLIKGLTLTNGGAGGVSVWKAKSVSILGCTIRGFAGTGGVFTPSSLSTLSNLLISDTSITANRYGVIVGSNGTLSAEIANATVSGNSQNGIDIGANISISVSDSVIIRQWVYWHFSPARLGYDKQV
jgi:hypothetical protein